MSTAPSAEPVTGPLTGLVLAGGGARAAYQVGVLNAVAQIRRECAAPRVNPFPVIAGTSAGAINAAGLACGADNFDQAVSGLCEVWENFSADQVYCADTLGLLRTGASWLATMAIGWAFARWHRPNPRSLLDNRPLRELLNHWQVESRLREMMNQGHLQALAVTASSYGSGLHVTFYDAVREIQPWKRSQRFAVRDTITAAHLLASSAIPFVFSAESLSLAGVPEYFGDGSMRQVAPISPAIHLGAERIFVIGSGRMLAPQGRHVTKSEYPSLAHIAGHALSSIFLNALAIDVERLQRMNSTLELLTPSGLARTKLRPIDVLLISPSERLDDIAGKHLHHLPLPVRTLLRAVGVSGRNGNAHGAALASYLLFEAPYTRELLTLGVADTMARRDEVMKFFGWQQPQA